MTTEPEGEITISEMIDQRIKEEGKIMIYRMRFGPSKTPLEITEDLNVNIISYDGKELSVIEIALIAEGRPDLVT